jgi:hypothetical protein
MIKSNIRKNKLLTVLSIYIAIVFDLTIFSQTVRNDLNQKLMMGYQGWFLCQGDGSPANDWRHWFRNSTNPSADQLNIDNWPDMTEYAKTYPTGMNYPNHTRARLFSSHDESTVTTHFKWMKDYGIYGVYLQRFLGEAVNDPRFFEIRNHVLENVIQASRTHGRHFALMYDITGVPDDGLYDSLVNDWETLVDVYDLENEDGYVQQNGSPVLAIWGIGFSHTAVTPKTAQALIRYFHESAAPKYRAYVIGGVPGQWRTLDGDSKSDPLWAGVYRSMDMISPWTVGRYNKNSVDNWKVQRIVPDLAECDANGIDYMPVIFPGGSWFNQTGRTDSSRINDNPRDGGNFYWRQAYNAIGAGVRYLYVAMFDEVDEGTAMFKLAPNNSGAPAQGIFVTLDEDGYDLPSDWYLRLAGESQKMLDRTMAPTGVMPITPSKISLISVTVSPASAVMAVGGMQQLTVAVAPDNAYDKTLTWSSTHTAAVTVSAAGRIRGVAIGAATVTATSHDGGLQSSCEVTVAAGSPVAGVTLSPTSASMDIGARLRLTAVITPADAINRKVLWSTNLPSVARVDTGGLVIAVAEGKATIKATTQDGIKTASSQITVSNPSQIPYGGTAWAIPGTIEGEDYDEGGEGVAYHDADAGTQGGRYRTDEGVDIEVCSEGGFNVGWFNAGEWIEYTVDVAASEKYDLEARVATSLDNARFHVEFGGVNKTGILDVPNTGGWQVWDTVGKAGFSLNAGRQVMRVFREVDGADFNLDNLAFISGASPVTEERPKSAKRYALHPAFPNPFNASARIDFEIPKTSDALLVVHDLLGRRIKVLVNRRLEPGYYSEHWNGDTEDRISAPSGIYLVRLRAGGFVRVDKLMLIR